MGFLLTISIPLISIVLFIITIMILISFEYDDDFYKASRIIAILNTIFIVILFSGYYVAIPYVGIGEDIDKLASYNCAYVIYHADKKDTINEKLEIWKYYMEIHNKYEILSSEKKKEIENKVKLMMEIK